MFITFLKKLIYRELIQLLSTTLTALFSHIHVLFVEDKNMIQTNTKIPKLHHIRIMKSWRKQNISKKNPYKLFDVHASWFRIGVEKRLNKIEKSEDRSCHSRIIIFTFGRLGHLSDYMVATCIRRWHYLFFHSHIIIINFLFIILLLRSVSKWNDTAVTIWWCHLTIFRLRVTLY